MFKFVSGYMVSNLTMTLAAQRAPVPHDSTLEFLAVDLSRAKGDRESALLKHIIITVTAKGSAPVPKTIQSARVESAGRMMRLAAGGTTQFSEVWSIPACAVCALEAWVSARVGLFPRFVSIEGNWKASAISLPTIHPISV
jgi:hypothetical protein